jgi:hypothetical protein
MTDELTTQAERAVADLEAVAAFLKGPFFQAQMGQAVRQAVIESQSPWVDRAGAAARWRCSETEIDRAARAGVLVRLERGDTPLFLKEQGDEAIRTGKWKLNKAKAETLKPEKLKAA